MINRRMEWQEELLNWRFFLHDFMERIESTSLEEYHYAFTQKVGIDFESDFACPSLVGEVELEMMYREGSVEV